MYELFPFLTGARYFRISSIRWQNSLCTHRPETREFQYNLRQCTEPDSCRRRSYWSSGSYILRCHIPAGTAGRRTILCTLCRTDKRCHHSCTSHAHRRNRVRILCLQLPLERQTRVTSRDWTLAALFCWPGGLRHKIPQCGRDHTDSRLCHCRRYCICRVQIKQICKVRIVY